MIQIQDLKIGEPESFYTKVARRAQDEGDKFLLDGCKVAQYITLAINPRIGWPEKLRYFQHVLLRHCHPPPYPDDDVWTFYSELANAVRKFAGREALRLAAARDRKLADDRRRRIAPATIECEAEEFFTALVPPECPIWFNEADYQQLQLIRDQWL